MRPCDVANRGDMLETVAWFLSEVGPLNIVVNAAGINVVRRKMAELDPNDFDTILAVNTTGLFNVLYAVLPDMRRRRQGIIFNISSVAGKRALPVAGQPTPLRSLRPRRWAQPSAWKSGPTESASRIFIPAKSKRRSWTCGRYRCRRRKKLRWFTRKTLRPV